MTKWRLTKILLIPNSLDVLGDYLVGHVRQDMRIIGELVFQCHVRVDVRKNGFGLFAGLSVNCLLQAALGDKTVNEIAVEALRDFFHGRNLEVVFVEFHLGDARLREPNALRELLGRHPKSLTNSGNPPLLGRLGVAELGEVSCLKGQ